MLMVKKLDCDNSSEDYFDINYEKGCKFQNMDEFISELNRANGVFVKSDQLGLLET